MFYQYMLPHLLESQTVDLSVGFWPKFSDLSIVAKVV